MLQIQNFESSPRLDNPTEIRKRIQHYSFCLTDKIGKGYSSTVYKGRNDLTNETVAIKMIQLKSIKDQTIKNLLQTELQCIKKINHRHLLKYIDSYQTVHNCYIITQYCDGGDLDKQLKLKGKFTQNQLIQFFAQFYPGYHSLLNAGYIHRDIKPANIFLKAGQIKIADFGMVKKISQNPRDNYNVGTPAYMPPQSMLSNIYTEKSDVWSIGVMCYQFIYGTLPWRGENQHQLKASIQNGRIYFDSSLASLDLIKFMTQCLEKNPNSRISISEMMSHPWIKKVIPHMTSMTVMPQRCFSPQTCPKFYLQYSTNQQNVNLLQSTQKRNQKAITPSGKTTTMKHSFNMTDGRNLRKLFAVPSLQFAKHGQNINVSNRYMKVNSERPTMDSEDRLKRKNQFMEIKTKNKKSAFDYLVSILNYLRYLYKIIVVLDQTNNHLIRTNTKKHIKSALVRELMKCLEKQQKMMKNQENVYGLNDWEEFKKGRKLATFFVVAEQYSQKYKKFIDKEKSVYNQYQNCSFRQIKQRQLSPQLKPLIDQLFKVVKNQLQQLSIRDQTNNIYQLLQLLEYLTTASNFEELINNFGWLTFVEKSAINTIVECKCIVDGTNYLDIWNKLQNRRKLIDRKTVLCPEEQQNVV